MVSMFRRGKFSCREGRVTSKYRVSGGSITISLYMEAGRFENRRTERSHQEQCGQFGGE
jgi:hypothetical protein